MNKPIMRPIKPEEDVEAAVADALEGLKVEEPGKPMAYAEDNAHRSLIPRSREFIQEPSGAASGSRRQRQREDSRVDQGA